MKYKKRPKTFDVVQWNGDTEFIEPDWIVNAIKNKAIIFKDGKMYIENKDAIVIVRKLDYIIKTSDDDLIVCNPDYFHKIYELAE